MSLQTGRRAIEVYTAANWTDPAPIGFDGHPFAVSAPSIRMSITEGAVRQSSIGKVTNTVHQIGLVTFQIFVDGGKGSNEWRGLADTLIGLFHNKVIDADGALVTSGAQTALVRFSPPELGEGQHPYIAGQFEEPPYYQVNLICPFVRYELR